MKSALLLYNFNTNGLNRKVKMEDVKTKQLKKCKHKNKKIKTVKDLSFYVCTDCNCYLGYNPKMNY